MQTVKNKIEQIFTHYDESASNKLIDIDGFKSAIKQGLLTLAHNIQETKIETVEVSDHKIAEIEVKLSDSHQTVTKMI